MSNSPINKVARAARTGSRRSRRAPGSTSYSWYALLIVISIVGTGLVAFSRHQHIDATSPGSTPPLAPSEDRDGDHWYAAYGIFLCDKFADPIDNTDDPYGVSTNNDGVIYIHPYEKKYAGNNADLGLFAATVGLKLKRDSVQLPNDEQVWGPGTKCGDKEGELVVKVWDRALEEDSGKTTKANPNDILLKDNSAITIAFVPKGEQNIPRPPSFDKLEQARASDPLNPANAANPQTAPQTPEPTPDTTPPATPPAGQ